MEAASLEARNGVILVKKEALVDGSPVWEEKPEWLRASQVVRSLCSEPEQLDQLDFSLSSLCEEKVAKIPPVQLSDILWGGAKETMKEVYASAPLQGEKSGSLPVLLNASRSLTSSMDARLFRETESPAPSTTCSPETATKRCDTNGEQRAERRPFKGRNIEPFQKTKMCAQYRLGQCRRRSEQCKFAHSLQELRATHDVYKTKLCAFWLVGHCKAGSACRHAHGEDELRPGSAATPITVHGVPDQPYLRRTGGLVVVGRPVVSVPLGRPV